MAHKFGDAVLKEEGKPWIQWGELKEKEEADDGVSLRVMAHPGSYELSEDSLETIEIEVGEPEVGLKFDTGKPRMDLLDAEWLEGVAQVLTFGAQKYAAHNWRKGISYSRIFAGVQRHLSAIQRGEDIDPESGLRHSWHAACGLMFLDWTLSHRPELDDRWKDTTS